MEKIENTQTRYWCVGHIFNKTEEQQPRFIEEGIWEAWFIDTADAQRQLKLAKEIKKAILLS